MRKKIKISDLVLGMYIDELCGSWMDHPFWKSSFKLVKQADLDVLHKTTVREVWIDTAKGLDASPAAEQSEAEPAEQQAEALLIQAAGDMDKPVRLDMEQELVQARKIQARAKRVVLDMFAEARMGKALPMGDMAELVDEINESVARNGSALLSLVRLKSKNDYTYLHSVAVCALMIALARQLDLPEHLVSELGIAGLLHDVGKIAIDNSVLNKPGRLTDAEFDLMKTHPLRGWEMLRTSGITDEITLDVCRHHHERMDGAGYPDRLSGDALSLYARMGAVCDVYDAVTSIRCYKQAWEPAEALRKMASWQKGHFDEKIFQAFVKTVGIYPTGTLVKLRSNRLAIVTDQSDSSLLLPVVKVFFSTSANTWIKQEMLDLSRSQDSVLSVEESATWKIDISSVA